MSDSSGARSIDRDRSDPHEEDLTYEVASRVASGLREQPWVIELTRSGWIAKAIVYFSLAWGAAVTALRRPWLGDAEYDSIAESLADGDVTRVLLGFIAFGLVLYILFRLLSIALIDTNDLNSWGHRLGYLLSAASYAVVSWTSAHAVVVGPSPDGQSVVERVSRSLLSSNPGRMAVGVGGLAGLASAGYFIYKGVTRRFLHQLVLDDMGARRRRITEWTGAIGWIGRGLIVGAAGLFVTWAAMDADPADARGLDSSLQRVAAHSLGAPVVMLIAAFLSIYAVYCLLTASKRQLSWSRRCDAGDHQPSASSST